MDNNMDNNASNNEQKPDKPEGETPMSEEELLNSSDNAKVKHELTTSYTLSNVTIICCVVSIVIGSTFLAIAALVCAIIAQKSVSKTNEAQFATERQKNFSLHLQKRAKLWVMLSIVAIVYNLTLLAILLPQVIAQVESLTSWDFSSMSDFFSQQEQSVWG